MRARAPDRAEWRQGPDEQLRHAPAFYAVIGLSLAAGVAMDVANVNAVQALYCTAVLDGLLAAFLLVGILLAASDARLMHGRPSAWPGPCVSALPVREGCSRRGRPRSVSAVGRRL